MTAARIFWGLFGCSAEKEETEKEQKKEIFDSLFLVVYFTVAENMRLLECFITCSNKQSL